MKFELKINFNNVSYNILFLYDNNYLIIKISEDNNKDKKYKDIKIFFNDNNDNITFKDFSDLIQNLKTNLKNQDSINILPKENGKKYLSITIINEEENKQKILEKEIILLNVKYYLTKGPENKRIYEEPFYSHLDIFDKNDLIEMLEKENIYDIYYIDAYKIKNSKGCFEKIGDSKYIINSEIELEFHCINKKGKYSLLKEIKNNEKYTQDIIKLKEKLNKYSQNMINYDLIYLYASPIVFNNEEYNRPISYREEIELIINIMKSKGKKFKCLFECMSINILREILLYKKTKILHISSHGELILKNKDGKNKKNTQYNLLCEDLDRYGEAQIYEEESLKAALKCLSNQINDIEVVVLSTCFSGGLEELISEHKPKNIIYVDKKTEIGDYTSVKFTKYFYEELCEGHSAEKSYKIALEKLRLDADILSYSIDRCCCKHFHTCNGSKKCIFHKYNLKKCKCNYEECHMHNKDCEIVLKAKNDYKIQELGDIVKICCCDTNISHNEILKFKFKRIKDDDGNEYNMDKNYFRYNIKGDVQINKNVITDFIAKKYYSIIGRKMLVRDIFEYISTHKNDIFIIVLFGEKGFKKKYFAESTCVFLFERKIIHKFDFFLITSDFDYEKMKEKIYKNEKMITNNKTVIIVKFTQIEKFNLNTKIEKIKNDFKDFKNLYFIIICDLILNLINNKGVKDERKNVKYFDAKIRNPEFLVDYYYNLYKGNYKLNKDALYTLNQALGNKRMKPKQLEKIAKLIAFENKTINDIIDIIENKQEELFHSEKKNVLILNEENKEIYSKYYFLSKCISGLPDCFMSLIFDKNEKNKNTISENLIKINKRNDWKYIEKDIIFTDENNNNIDMIEYAKKHISKSIKIYAVLLDHFIEQNRNDIYFRDSNIHLIFNSFNSDELWKSRVKELYMEEKLDISNINFSNKDFDIIKHKENIVNLISLVINNIEKFDSKLIIYIKEILLLFPSTLFLNKYCKDILQKCRFFCEKCIEYFKRENKLCDVFILKEFNLLNNKILLFQYSIGEINQLENINDNEDLKLQSKLLIFLKSLENEEEKELKELEDIIKKGKIKSTKKISLFYYEFSKKYFYKKEIQKSTEYLNKAIINLLLYITLQEKEEDLSLLFDIFFEKLNRKEINLTVYNIEIKYLFRMIIDSCHLFKASFESIAIKASDITIKEKIGYLNKILIEDIDSKLYKEAINLRNELYNLMQPDIIMLNSNPIKDKYSLLSSGIDAYLNNQYYILKKLKELNNDEIESYIRIKSYLLNLENLLKALNQKGEILILQSDDFTENGDIILESENGISQLLTVEDFIKISPFKIKYKAIILCFNNSEKLAKYFDAIDYQYLIYFEYFDSFNMNNKALIEYNKLCVEFIIDFIKLSSEYDSVETIFKKAKNIFIKKINNIFMNKKPCKEFIYLNNKYKNIQLLEYIQENKEIFLYETLPILNDNYESNNYSYEMNDIIQCIKKEKYKILPCCQKKKMRFIKIGFELIKFFHRHKTFVQYYDFDMNSITNSKLKQIIKKSEKNFVKEDEDGFLKNNFYFIYNCKEGISKEIVLEDSKYNNDFFFILYDFEHESGDCDSENSSRFDSEENDDDDEEDDEDDRNYLDEFSIFNDNI